MEIAFLIEMYEHLMTLLKKYKITIAAFASEHNVFFILKMSYHI